LSKNVIAAEFLKYDKCENSLKRMLEREREKEKERERERALGTV
jgi:hypothetical protein